MNAKNPRTARRLVRRYRQRHQPRNVGARLRSTGRRANPSHPVRRYSRSRPQRPAQRKPYVLHRTQHSAYTNKQRRKVARYKRSRKYYRDYRGAQFARRQMVFGRSRALGKMLGEGGDFTTLEGLRNRGRLVDQPPFGQAAMNQQLTRSPGFRRLVAGQEKRAGDVAGGVYDAYLNRLWKRVHGSYPKGAKMPKTEHAHKPVTITDAAGRTRDVPAWAAGGKVGVSPEMARRYADSADRYSKVIPIHEWAHVFQNHRKISSKGREGGADAFEYIVAPRAGLKAYKGDPKYRHWAHMVRHKKGKGWVLYGQFR